MSECTGPGCTHPECTQGRPVIKPDSFPGLRQIVANAYRAKVAPQLTVGQIENMRDRMIAQPLRSQYR